MALLTRQNGRELLINDVQKEAKNCFLSKISSGEYKTIPHPCLCGCKDGIILAQEDRYGIPYQTVICPRCGIVRADPYYDEKTIANFYKYEYRQWYAGNKYGNEPQFNERVNRGTYFLSYLSQYISINNKSKIFEIGCADGGSLIPFKNLGAEVYGCDYGSDYIEYGKSKGLNVEFGGFEILKKYGKADVILMSHCLEHIVNPIKDLKKIRKLLKPSGILFVIVPGIENINTTYGNDIFSYLQNAHVFNFSSESLGRVIEAAGFNVYGVDVNTECVCIAKLGKEKKIKGLKGEAMRIIRMILSYEALWNNKNGICDNISFISNKSMLDFMNYSQKMCLADFNIGEKSFQKLIKKRTCLKKHFLIFPFGYEKKVEGKVIKTTLFNIIKKIKTPNYTKYYILNIRVWKRKKGNNDD